MTPTEIKSALSKISGHANKRLGQHFLIDHATLETIVDAASIHPGDLVLEIGPGLGVLTRELLAKGADVTAIEKDRRFVGYLNHPPSPSSLECSHEEGVAEGRGRLRIIQGDAATTHWHEIIGDNPWKLISNLPYGITSLALRKALWAPRPASKVVVLVQKEVAERAIALTPSTSSNNHARGRAGRGSLLSLMVALASESARIIRRVPAGAFYPPPKVESAVLEILPMTLADREKRWGIDPEKIMALAKKGFAHPRKLLASNLGVKKIDVEGIPEKARAENLSSDDWARLAQNFS